VLPFLTIPTPTRAFFCVPVDDYHTSFIYVDGLESHDSSAPDAARYERAQLGPPSNYDNGTYRWGPAQRWGQDRSKMRTGSFTGIEGLQPEDFAVSASMGPVYDRTKEHLVPADALVIRMRRRLLEAARDLAAGKEPIMLSAAESAEIGGGPVLLDD